MITQTSMKPKNANTNFHEPMPLRILSAASSPNVSSSLPRTPGCLCHCVFQAIVGPPLYVDCTKCNFVIGRSTLSQVYLGMKGNTSQTLRWSPGSTTRVCGWSAGRVECANQENKNQQERSASSRPFGYGFLTSGSSTEPGQDDKALHAPCSWNTLLSSTKRRLRASFPEKKAAFMWIW